MISRTPSADRLNEGVRLISEDAQLAGERAVRIHPLVARLIDQDVLAKLQGAATAGARKPQALTGSE